MAGSASSPCSRLLHHDGLALGGDRGIARAVSAWETVLYVVVAFLAAALAFVVEPLVARALLPTYGGTSAVWTTALVFFQNDVARRVRVGPRHLLGVRASTPRV
jgi:hypothetical protein